MKSYNRPTSELLEATIPLLSSPQHERYFFSRLENPYWVELLHDRKFFKFPPKAEHLEDGTRFPQWPPSKYLARMAKHVPDEVAVIFTGLKTDNASIVGDMIEAALAMPIDNAATLVPSICQAIREVTLWIYFKEANALCVSLAVGDKVSEAMTLAEALFAPTFSEGQDELNQMDEYWYKEELKKVVPKLAGRASQKFLPMLCGWLGAFVQAMKDVDSESGSDNSFIWRPAIQEHEENRDYELAGVVAGFVREGFEIAIREKRLSLDKGLEILRQNKYLIFKRIGLHLINKFATDNPELVRQTIMNHDLFGDYQYKHEYAMLVGRRLDILSPGEQKQWFDWIDTGPDISNHDTTKEDRQSRKRYWQFKKLHWVRDHLNNKWQVFYDEMINKHGEPELADLNFRSGLTQWGHDSPIAIEALTGISFDEVVAKVSSWQPEEPRGMGPDIEGLATVFKQYVKSNLSDFSGRAQSLVERPAIFVRGFISQMSEAVKNGVEIDYLAVFGLCRWVVECPIEERTIPLQEYEGLVDKNWQWTREEICQFIENICKAMSGEKPKYLLEELRQPIWQLLEVLCRDNAESNIVKDDTQIDPRTHDYLTLGMNSSRGKAVEAALEYANWVAKYEKITSDGQETVPDGFAAISEVRDMLTWQLSPKNRSVGAFSVIGLYIGLLYLIDKEWLSVAATKLFYLEGIEEVQPVVEGWSAWNTFLVWGNPHIEFYRMFKTQYAYTVEQAKKIKITESSRAQPMFRLGEHLMLLYGRGQLGLDEDEGLLRRFLFNSNPDVRRYAIRFVGQSLKGNEKVPDEVVKRFQTLWDTYWPEVGKIDAEENSNDDLFGTWFSSGQFPEEWALKRLEEFIEVIPLPKSSTSSVLEQLVKVACCDIERSIRILDRIVRADHEGWRIREWQESIMQILRLGVQCDNNETLSVTINLINYLGRRGYTAFGELLSEKAT